MFSKLSRYRRVPDIAVPDARGRVVAAKDFRPLPEVTGTVTHIVDSGDRLDQLAFTFYGQPLQYWHLCDANPEFLSPLGLLGKEPVVTTRVPLTAHADPPPWAALIAGLSGLAGVDDVTVEESVPPGGAVDRAVLVTHHRSTVDVTTLLDVIGSAGFATGLPVDRGRLGRPVVVPPSVT